MVWYLQLQSLYFLTQLVFQQHNIDLIFLFMGKILKRNVRCGHKVWMLKPVFTKTEMDNEILIFCKNSAIGIPAKTFFQLISIVINTFDTPLLI